jgi:hypothetical protein
MNAAQKIRQSLYEVMDEGKANACRIYKGQGFEGHGWYVERFGSTPTFYGSSVAEAISTVEDIAAERAELY